MKFKILFILLTLSISAFSQPNKERHEQVKALKISFITTELDLTSSESEKFWPIYNAFEEKQFQIRHNKMRPLVKKIDKESIARMTDKEALAHLSQLEDAEEELFNLRRKLTADLKPVIGPVKILKLKKSEEDFNRKLLSKYKGKKK